MAILKHECEKCSNDSYTKKYDFELSCDVWHCANCGTRYKKVRVKKAVQSYQTKIREVFDHAHKEGWSREEIQKALMAI